MWTYQTFSILCLTSTWRLWCSLTRSSPLRWDIKHRNIWPIMTYKSFLYLTFDDGEEEKTLPCNIPFCFCASRELPCECSQLWSISSSPQFYKIFLFLVFSLTAPLTYHLRHNSSRFSFPRKCFSLAHLSARWCQRKSSCDKETWLESSNWTLELFMTTLVLFNLFGLGLWAFDTPLNWGILWH